MQRNITQWSGFDDVEATMKANTGTTGGNSLYTTQQWMEPDDDNDVSISNANVIAFMLLTNCFNPGLIFSQYK